MRQRREQRALEADLGGGECGGLVSVGPPLCNCTIFSSPCCASAGGGLVALQLHACVSGRRSSVPLGCCAHTRPGHRPEGSPPPRRLTPFFLMELSTSLATSRRGEPSAWAPDRPSNLVGRGSMAGNGVFRLDGRVGFFSARALLDFCGRLLQLRTYPACVKRDSQQPDDDSC